MTMEDLMAESLAPSSLLKYESSFTHWESFASSNDLPVIPISVSSLASFITFLVNAGRSHSFIQTVISAISFRHSMSLADSPTQYPSIVRLLQGVKRHLSSPPICREPLTIPLLRDLMALVTVTGNFQKWRTLWRMLLQFFAFLRWSDICQLKRKHFKISPSSIDIFIPSSKTDQFHQGQTVFVAALHDDLLCPVAFTNKYISCLGIVSPEDWMLPRVNSAGRLQIALTKYSTALSDLKALIKESGRDPAVYGEHSGHRGGAMTAFSAGLPWVDIKRLGRWKSDSAVQGYLDPSAEHSRNVPSTFARAVSGSSISFTGSQDVLPVRSISEGVSASVKINGAQCIISHSKLKKRN